MFDAHPFSASSIFPSLLFFCCIDLRFLLLLAKKHTKICTVKSVRNAKNQTFFCHFIYSDIDTLLCDKWVLIWHNVCLLPSEKDVNEKMKKKQKWKWIICPSERKCYFPVPLKFSSNELQSIRKA